jgi:hypothetical protein
MVRRTDRRAESIRSGRHGPVQRRGRFHWWNNRELGVRDGFLAHVSVSARSAADARIPVVLRDYSMGNMVPAHSRRPGED